MQHMVPEVLASPCQNRRLHRVPCRSTTPYNRKCGSSRRCLAVGSKESCLTVRARWPLLQARGRGVGCRRTRRCCPALRTPSTGCGQCLPPRLLVCIVTVTVNSNHVNARRVNASKPPNSPAVPGAPLNANEPINSPAMRARLPSAVEATATA